MCEEINININETNENINIISSEILENIDINVAETTEEVTLNITEEVIQVNINKLQAGSGIVETIVAGNNINVDSTDVANPIVSADLTGYATETYVQDNFYPNTNPDGYITINDVPNPTLQEVTDNGKIIENDADDYIIFKNVSSTQIGNITNAGNDVIYKSGNTDYRDGQIVFNSEYIDLPNASGTLALTSDIPTSPTLQDVVDNGNEYTKTIGDFTYTFNIFKDFGDGGELLIKVLNNVTNEKFEITGSTGGGGIEFIDIDGNIATFQLTNNASIGQSSSFGANTLKLPKKTSGSGEAIFQPPNNKPAGNYTLAITDDIPSPIIIDTTPIDGSSNAVSSNGVFDALANKVDKVTGKGLSTEDYTTTEKSKLAGIQAGAEVNVNADWNATSGDAQILNKPNLATVATSGSYTDLINKPTIPAAQIQSDWTQANTSALDYIKNKPTIPSITNLVPYTGATQDVDLGNNNLNAKGVKINGTAGSGHLGLKHQSANATAGGQETALFAGSDGELYYKNDGNTLAQIASRAWVNAQGFITSVITALGYTPANKAGDTFTGAISATNLSGTNTGDETTSTIKTKLGAASTSTDGYLTSTDWNTFNGKQSALVSGTNIKTVNSNSLLGSGNISVGTVTSVSALTLGTSGTDLSSSVATGTTTPVITLNVPTASATNRGVLSSTDWTTFNNKQDKTMSAYSFRVNNTNATANATETTYKAFSQQTYTGSLTWSASGAPTGATNHSYNWVQVGNLVTLTINIVFATVGSGVSAVAMSLPSDCPNPVYPSGISGASANLYFGMGRISGSPTATTGNAAYSVLRRNSADTAFELYMLQSTGALRMAQITIQYYTS